MTTPKQQQQLPPVDLSQLPSEFAAAVDAIRKRLPHDLATPRWGIICGSGLSGLATTLQNKVEVPYETIPGFAKSSVEGHKSALAFGFLSQAERRVPVVACLGRFHTYEGYTPQQVVFPVRIMRCLGAQAVVVTNAAGGLHPEFEVGTIMALHDHLSIPSFTPMNPLVGPNLAALGPRFPPLSDAYDASLRVNALRAADALGLPASEVRQGTYGYVMGPTYESRAECRFLRSAGADAVGMSTVPEVIAARHAGMRVLALSLITNKVVTSAYFDAREALRREQAGEGAAEQLLRLTLEQDDKEKANHEEVLEVGRVRAEAMRSIVQSVICQSDV